MLVNKFKKKKNWRQSIPSVHLRKEHLKASGLAWEEQAPSALLMFLSKGGSQEKWTHLFSSEQNREDDPWGTINKLSQNAYCKYILFFLKKGKENDTMIL